MATDIRIKTSFPHHVKTKKLIRKIGHKGFYCLITLWCYCSINKPKGILNCMTIEDIAIASEWDDEPQTFIEALTDCGFLFKDDEQNFVLHDWKDHNRWSYFSEKRSEIARKNVSKRYKKRNDKLPSEHNNLQMVYESYNPYTDGIETVYGQYTPSPIPSPIPIPIPKDKKTTFVSSDFCKISFDPRTGEFSNISQKQIQLWAAAYPAIAVEAEIRKASAWLLANPKNRKSNYNRFLTNWFTRSQDKAPRADTSNSTHKSNGYSPRDGDVPFDDPIKKRIYINKETYDKAVAAGLKNIEYRPLINAKEIK